MGGGITFLKMFSLPSLAPQDSYSLWYTSSTTPNPSAFTDHPSPSNPHDHTTTHQTSRRHLPAHRTPLSRLRHDEVPDADADATRLLDSDSESSEGDEENDVDDVPRNVLASRLPDDVYREALIRGDEVRQTRFGEEDSVGDEDEGGENLLQEEDLMHEHHDEQHDLDMNMDGDLDNDIPEASVDGYEHTDTEEELSSSEEDSEDDSQLPQRAAASSMVRSDGTQNSMDLSNLMSGSSQLGSSPRRLSGFRNRRGRSS